MSSESEEFSFEDPKLKAAVKRVLGGQQMPAGLRTKLLEQIEVTSDDEQAAPAPIPMFRTPWFRMALAAVLMIGIGLVAWRVVGVRDSNTTHLASTSLPESFAAALVATHDHCCAAPDHHVLKGVPDDDFRMMSKKLRESLGFPALAAAAGDGWTFKGASPLCPVGPAHSAHLVFKKDSETLSIFSVAVSSQSWPDGNTPVDGAHFTNREADHPIVSWVHGGVVFSVVAANSAGKIDLGDIQPIADRLQGEVLAAEERSWNVVALRD